MQALVAGLPMLNFSPSEPVLMETRVGPRGLAAVFLQQDPGSGRWMPVAAYSREVQAAELARAPVYLELVVLQEGLKRMAHVSICAADLRIRVSPDLAAVWRH